MLAFETIGTHMKTPLIIAAAALFFAACTDIQRPRPEQYYGAAAQAPVRQELRWSNGKVPRSVDPARAAAAPETDLVRAVYEGLTDLDSRTLEAVPALAEKWVASEDHRVWTFDLRANARWTNGKRVTASDVAASWQRVVRLGKKAANRDLFQNIVGSNISDDEIPAAPDFETSQAAQPSPTAGRDVPIPTPSPAVDVLSPENKIPAEPKAAKKLAVEAIDDSTLRVTLLLPDKDFPKLVANPVFRPVYGNGEHFETEAVNNGIVTNGPFKISLVSKEGVTLERSETYWNSSGVRLDGVKFVANDTAEAALDAYRKGELDAVTNAELEPLAVKLLAPFEDFRQARHGAVNLYQVNVASGPFRDRRVREALATSIDRDKLIDGELEGATEPARTLLPLASDKSRSLSFDPVRARSLLEKAGFPEGTGFPAIRLVINRNNTQQRVARTVAQMWKQQLNVDTEIIVRETSDMEAVRASGEYDLIRRGIVLPTSDELVSMTSILGSGKRTPAAEPKPSADDLPKAAADIPAVRDEAAASTADEHQSADTSSPAVELITADEAMHELTVIPLYFPVSYALVKPYLQGFELNGLDAFSLQDVSINNEWKPEESSAR